MGSVKRTVRSDDTHLESRCDGEVLDGSFLVKVGEKLCDCCEGDDERAQRETRKPMSNESSSKSMNRMAPKAKIKSRSQPEASLVIRVGQP